MKQDTKTNIVKVAHGIGVIWGTIALVFALLDLYGTGLPRITVDFYRLSFVVFSIEFVGLRFRKLSR